VIKSYSIQIGAFTQLKKAAIIRAILENIGPTRVEKIQSERKDPLYRVLIGDFKTIEEAEKFSKQNRLERLFKGMWFNPVTVSNTATVATAEVMTADDLDQDPQLVHVHLYCEDKKKYGDYRVELPNQKGASEDLSLKVNWSCQPVQKTSFAEKDRLRSPSHFFISPLFGAGSLSAKEASTFGNIDRTDFAYGAEVGAFKSFGGLGPTFEYRFLNHRFSGGNTEAPSPQFTFTHRALVGARLPLSHRFEFQPLFGFFTGALVQGPTASEVQFQNPILGQLGLRFTWHLMELSERTWLNLIFGYSHLLGSDSISFATSSGNEWNVKFQTRHFFPSDWGVDWFFEYTSRSQGTPTLDQSSSLIVLGISALGPF
jgi:hypothetical protein